jgi:DNA-binding NtrC family response regulator
MTTRGPRSDRSGLLHERLRECERRTIEEYLEQHHGNVSATAKTLGITRKALDLKLLSHGLREHASALREAHGIKGSRVATIA